MCPSNSFATEPSPSPLRPYRWYQAVQARVLRQGNKAFERQMHDSKVALFGQLRGTVLEIGAGVGANLPYFAPEIRYIAVEPNPLALHALRERAAGLGRDVEPHVGVAESLPLASESVDAVVCTLVLCSVADVAQALAEIRRVLKPDGRLVFIEHVAAPEGTLVRCVQRVMRGPQRVLADGCRSDQDTAAAIEAAGFRTVLCCPDRFRGPYPVPLIVGIALR